MTKYISSHLLGIVAGNLVSLSGPCFSRLLEALRPLIGMEHGIGAHSVIACVYTHKKYIHTYMIHINGKAAATSRTQFWNTFTI